MNENPTASKTFFRPSAPIPLEFTSLATCRNVVMVFWRHILHVPHRPQISSPLYSWYVNVLKSCSLLHLQASVRPSSRYLSWHFWVALCIAPSPLLQLWKISELYLGLDVNIFAYSAFLRNANSAIRHISYCTVHLCLIRKGSMMDLESVFDGPLSSGSSGKKSGVSVTVWQAEVALRLSESPEILIACWVRH